MSYTLWHRPAGGLWAPLGSAATEDAAWQLAYAKMHDAPSGDWIVLPDGTKPRGKVMQTAKGT